MPLNLVTVRRSNGDNVVTQVVIKGNNARAYVAPETPPPAASSDKSSRRPPRQVIPAVVTTASACYAARAGFRTCRGSSLIRHHPVSR